MAEGKLTVGVQIDASQAFAGFADSVIKQMRPQLDQIQRNMQNQVGGGGGGGGFSQAGSIAGGAFVGSLGSQLAVKGLAVIQDFAAKAAAAVGSIFSGGWDRLVSIDTARTKMTALKVSAADTEIVMKNALDAVRGTAFGLGDAATVAASALAAGVKPGKALTDYLKLTADTAAVARKAGQDMGSAFNEVGYVLNKVTTQGYATNQELQMLSDKGLPIYQNLAKNLDKSAGAVIELAEKTGVAASDVRAALQDTVGGAALVMGQSFEGAMENARAAFDRLGESLLKPIFTPAKDGVGSITAAIDELTATINEHQPDVIEFFTGVGQAAIVMTQIVAMQVGMTAMQFGLLAEQVAMATNVIATQLEILHKPLKLIPDVLLPPLLQDFKDFGEETVESMRGAAVGANGFSDKMKGLSDAAGKFATETGPKMGQILDGWSEKTKAAAAANAEYVASQKQLAAAVEMGLGPLVYQAQMTEWLAKVRGAASGGPAPGPAPIMPTTAAPTAPGAGMPADVAKQSGSAGGGSDKTPWLAPGAPIPTYEELLAAGGGAGATVADEAVSELPPAAADLSNAATDLSSSATELSKAAAAATASAQFPSLAGITPISPTGTMGAHAQIAAANSVAASLGLSLTSGLRPVGSTTPGSYHDSGQAGDFSNDSGNTTEMLAFAELMSRNFAPYISELIYSDPRFSGNLLNGQPHQYSQGTLNDHVNHVHLAIRDGVASEFAAAVAAGGAGVSGLVSSFMPPMPPIPSYGGSGGADTTLGPGKTYGTPINVPGLGTVVPINEIDYSQLGLAPGTYQIPAGITAPDPAKIAAQAEVVRQLEQDIVIKDARIREMKADASRAEQLAAAGEMDKLKTRKAEAEKELAALQRGETGKPQTITVGQPSKAQAFDYNSLPFGHPSRILAGMIGGMGGTPEDISALIGPIMGSTAGPIGSTVGGIAGAIAGVPLPGPMGYPGTPTAPSTDLNKLVQQQNPLALFQAAGIDVPDYSRAGGGPQDLMPQTGPPTDAMGRMYSDTAALIDRTFTNLDAAEKARHDQVMTVMNEVRDRLAKDYVEPVTTAAVTGGINGMGDSASTAIGTSMGQAAGPIIASAVSSASAGSGGEGAALVNTGVGAVTSTANALGGFAAGGPVIGPGSGVSDSILARVSHGEYVLPAADVARMGGFASVDRFRSSLWGSVPRFATGGGVDVSSTVGAEFFGVAQVPIISTIVNLLIAVLLKIIGVTIEARDTLNEISSDFREFRGDFKAFDASGRLMNDTSGLIDRTGSSEQAAADERIRILKLVLEGLFKFIVEKIIVPIAKAVGNSLLQAAAGAAQGAMGAAFPGGSIVGGMVGNVITSAGGAAIEIAGEVGTILAESIFSVGLEASGSLLQSLVPGLTNALFGGGLLSMIVDPITGVLNGLLGGVAQVFGGLFGGLSTLIPGLPFDEGGIAIGTGLMPKATIRPERVLSPQQTQSFDRLVDALASGRASARTTIHAPFTVVGGERGGREARDRLLALMS